MRAVNNVILVNPDVGGLETRHRWRRVRAVLYRVGYTASVLREHVEHISIIDMKLHDLQYFRDRAAAIKPDLVMIRCGLNAASFSASAAPMARKMAQAVKQVSHEIRVVIAGPYPTIIKQRIVDDPVMNEYVDFFLYGEEEVILPELIDCLNCGEDVGALQGVSSKRAGQWVHNTQSRFVQDLDALPWPAYDLMEMDRYLHHAVISSRGCPFRCSFCTVGNVAGPGQRLRSVKDFVGEIEFLYRTFGRKTVSIRDENFFHSRERVLELCREILSLPVRIRWMVFQGGRVDKVDTELLARMKEAGCYLIGFGLESGDDAVLQSIHKQITAAQVRDTARMMLEVGMQTWFFITVGNPGDTSSSVDKTLLLLKDVAPDYVIVNMVVPYPNTPLHTWASEHATILQETSEDTFYNNDTLRVPKPAFETREFSAKERVRAFRRAVSMSIGMTRPRVFLTKSLRYFVENPQYWWDLCVQWYFFLYFRWKKRRKQSRCDASFKASASQ